MSNTSLSDFINAAAKVMRADRPHLWESHDEAVRDITIAFSDVSGLDPDDEEEYSVHLSGFMLTRTVLDEGVFEYTLSKKLVSLAIYTDDEESATFDWTRKSELNLADGVDLGLPEDEFDDDLDIEPNIVDDIYYDEDDE
jgi:hypothetical protein